MKKLVFGIAFLLVFHSVIFPQTFSDNNRRISVAAGERRELRLDKDVCAALLDDYPLTINILGKSFNALLEKGTTFPVPSGIYMLAPPDNKLDLILSPAGSCSDG